MNAAATPSHPRTSKRVLETLIIIPVVTIMVLAVGLSTASMLESMRFARATDQILNLVTSARDFASRQERFATQPGEDLLATMSQAGLITDTVTSGSKTQLNTPWQSPLGAVVSAPHDMRLEIDVPPQACRRLALFFSGHVSDLGLRTMEAREGINGAWRRFYESGSHDVADEPMVLAACGTESPTSLALVFHLRS